jgi:hypothetical protein
MSAALQSSTARTALALINASGHVIVDAALPVSDLVALAAAAAEWGATLTLRGAHACAASDLERVAQAGRGRVTFDLVQ